MWHSKQLDEYYEYVLEHGDLLPATLQNTNFREQAVSYFKERIIGLRAWHSKFSNPYSAAGRFVLSQIDHFQNIWDKYH